MYMYTHANMCVHTKLQVGHAKTCLIILSGLVFYPPPYFSMTEIKNLLGACSIHACVDLFISIYLYVYIYTRD